MHAFLIVSKKLNDESTVIDKIIKDQKIKREIPFVLQKIEDSRELKKLVKFSFNEKTAIIIDNIDSTTNEALNSFLKNLEEPTQNIFYILKTSNLEAVLPTITSRCQVIIIKDQDTSNSDDSKFKEFMDSNLDYQLEYISKIKDRAEAITFISDLIHYEHQNNKFENQQILLNTLRNLKANGNVSLQLSNFVVTMNR